MANYIDERDAEDIMRKIGAEEAGVKYMLPKTKFRLISLNDVRNAMANIIKQEMLSLGGDAALNKGCVNCSVENSDILIMGTIKQIRGLIKKMKIQVSESKDIAIELERLINS